MPSNKEHCAASLKRYGREGKDIHKWMDEPYKLYGTSHRKARHDFNQEIPLEFIQRYGEAMARNIMNDHIMLDLDKGDLSKQDIKDIRYGKTDIEPILRRNSFEETWSNIQEHQNEEFCTYKKREFTYTINNGEIQVNKAVPPITKSMMKKAYMKIPVFKPSDLKGITKGTSYAWSLLNDPRIIQDNPNNGKQGNQENGTQISTPIREPRTQNVSCKTCAWARFLRKTNQNTGFLGLFQDTVYTNARPSSAKQKDVDLYCVIKCGSSLRKLRWIKHYTNDEVSKIGFFSTPCDSWVSKNR